MAASNYSIVRLFWAVGMLTWYFLFLYRAHKAGIPLGKAAEIAVAAILAGYACGYLLIGGRFQSTWAIAGAALGALAWTGVRGGANWLSFAEAAFFAFPFAWVPVRVGCVLERVHFGLRSDSWLALPFPDGRRWDLALIEALWAVALSAVFLWMRNGHWSRFQFTGVALASLGLFRLLVLSPLQLDPRDSRLAMVLLAGFGVGAVMAVRAERRPRPLPDR